MWSANVRVNDAPGTASEPAIAVDAAGNAYAAWTDSRNGDPDIYFAYRPAGGTWAANLRVNGDPGAAQQREPAIGVDAAGIVSIAWTDSRNGNDDIYYTRGPASGPWSGESRLNDDSGSATESMPQLIVDGPGSVIGRLARPPKRIGRCLHGAPVGRRELGGEFAVATLLFGPRWRLLLCR